MTPQKISSLREKKGWSLRRLAKESGIAHNRIYDIEKGITPNPTVETLQRLAWALNCPLWETWEEIPRPKTKKRSLFNE